MTTNVSQVVREIVAENQNGDSLQLALLVMARCSKDDLLPLVQDAVEGAQRENVRMAEQAALNARYVSTRQTVKNATGQIVAQTPQEVSIDFMRLMKAKFTVGPNEKEWWFAATVQQHRERIANLSKMKNGLQRTIDLHAAAIQAITTAGGDCLADVPGLVIEEEAAD